MKNGGLNLSISVFGSKVNSWPTLLISINDCIVYNKEVSGSKTISIDVDVTEVYHINISGIGKKFGEDGVYDTIVDSQGNIIQDKSLIITDISVNGIAMDDHWIRSLPFFTDNFTNFSAKGFYTSGELRFSITEPVLDWIINERFIKHKTQNTQIFGGGDKFEYTEILNKIDHIKKTYFND